MNSKNGISRQRDGRPNFRLTTLACTVLAASVSGAYEFQKAPEEVPPQFLAGMKWRNIGPFRGGRVSAVAGIPGSGSVFYIGLPQGGVWKTTSAGQTWYPVFDSIRDTSVIGSVQVAPSNPNVVYAGTGEISGGGQGVGMYRSNDAGTNWRRIGLEASKQIPTIFVDQKDANIVLAATLGSRESISDERGVYRSVDGGKNWTKTLFVDNSIGVQHLARADDQQNIIIATSERSYYMPGQRRPNQDASSGTALYKSLDAGITWKKLAPKGLPKLDGRCTVAIASGTNAQRVFLIGTMGLYRSDDGGDNWQRMAAGDERIANGQGNYTSGVYVDPKNPDIVYTLATCVYRSLDGGKSFEAFKGAPDGDDPQQLWIDPTDGNRILYGGDQGAVVSLDAGKTWGSWYNQPTGQFADIGVSNDWPYWVFGTQQDSGGIAISSRGNFGEISPVDWTPHSGSEGGPMLVDPLDSHITYCQGAGGWVRITSPSGQWSPINPPEWPGAEIGPLRDLVFSTKNPHELFGASRFLISTTDGGAHWQKLSADLTVREDELPKKGAAAQPFRGSAVNTIAPSPLDANCIWIGTTNGLVKVTRDHGRTWETVSLPGAAGSKVAVLNSIVAAPKSKTEAYASVTPGGPENENPHVYRTRDFGRSWTEIVQGLPTGKQAWTGAGDLSVDAKHPGVLFLMTRSKVYTSTDDGDHWQSINLNLPLTTFTKLIVHGDDLVLSTYGRGIWILDDFALLREISPSAVSEPVHLFKPATAIRVRRNLNQDTPFPPEVPHALNPPLGAIIDYSLSAKPKGFVTIEILDRSGHVVRHYSSAPVAPYTDAKPPEPDWWFEPRDPLPTEVGGNRINWDLRYDVPPAFFHDPSYPGPAVEHDTPFAIEGPLVVPGEYTVRLTVEGKSTTQLLTVVNDPRSPGTQREMEALHEVQMRYYQGIQEAWDGYHQLIMMRATVAEIIAGKPADEVVKAAKAFDEKLAALSDFVPRPGGPQQRDDFKTLNGLLISQMNDLDYGDKGPTDAVQLTAASAWARLKTLVDEWRALNKTDLSKFNAVLSKFNLRPINPAPALVDPPRPLKKFLPPAPAKTVPAVALAGPN